METNKAEIPQRLLQGRFTDMQSVSQALNWQQQFRQLDPGELNVWLDVVGHGRCVVTRIEFDRSFHQVATPPEGFLTFGLPDPEKSQLHKSGQDIHRDVMVNFNCDGALNVNNEGSFRGYILQFSRSQLAPAMELLSMKEFLEREITQTAFWLHAAEDSVELRAFLTDLFRTIDRDESLATRDLQESFDVMLPIWVLSLMMSSTQAEVGTSSARQSALARALRALELSEQPMLSVSDLCEQAASSYSTLNRAFKDEFGVATKDYLKAYRLAGVQRELVARESRGTITQVANRWGFWHLGDFSAEYKKQFGELPSQSRIRAHHQ